MGVLGIAPSEFWLMTPAALSCAASEHREHADASRKTEDYRAGIVASRIAGGSPGDFFPSLRLTPEEQAERVAAQWKHFVTVHNTTRAGNGAS